MLYYREVKGVLHYELRETGSADVISTLFLIQPRMLVSFFPKLMNPEPSEALHLLELLASIQEGRGAKQVLAARALAPNGMAYSQAKKILPSFRPSGTFERRTLAGRHQHSGIVALDLDASQNRGVPLAATKALLAADPTTYAYFTSVGGMGLCVLVRIPAENHKGSFRALSAYYQKAYGLNVDQACGDMGRLRFVSYDSALYLNEQAAIFAESLPEHAKPLTATPVLDTILPTSI